MTPVKRVYVAVFLDAESKEALLKAAPPKHQNVYGEHLTLAFGRHMKESYPLGQIVELTVDGLFDDDRGQAVSVVREDHLHELLWADQQPHITVSCGLGVKPLYSNELIKMNKITSEAGTRTMQALHLKLKGIIDYFPRTPKEVANGAVPVPSH